MTLDRNINHSFSEINTIREKAIELNDHVGSHECCGLDGLGKLIVYLFFVYLTSEDRDKEENENRIDILKGLDNKDLTELAFRARLIEKDNGMEDYEIFSFISSLRDKLFFNIKEELSGGSEESSNSFFSSFGYDIEVDEIYDLVAFIWRRYISRHYTDEELRLSQSILSIADGDYILLESNTLPGLFMSIGKEKECDVVFSIDNVYERTLSKMLFIMTVPEDKWNRYRFIKEITGEESLRNNNRDGLEYPNKVVSFSSLDAGIRVIRDQNYNLSNKFFSIKDLIERGAKTLFFVSSGLLSFGKGGANKLRKEVFNIDSSLSVLSFCRRYQNIIFIDGTKKREEEVLMLNLDEVDIVFDDVTCSEIAASITGDEEKAGDLKDRAIQIKRDTIEKDDYMLYPPYFIEKKVGEIRGLSEIDAKLDEKYRDLSALCRRMRG
ncbi:MAG: hypothetical protein ACI4NI_04385 [Candidatus Ornithospirochaeta sp.]